MADHRLLRSKRDNYPQLKVDRKNKRFISGAGVFLLLGIGGINPLTWGRRNGQVTTQPGEGPHNPFPEMDG